MNWKYPLTETYFAARYLADNTKPDGPLVGFSGGEHNTNFRLLSEALNAAGISNYYGYYRSTELIPTFKKTTLWISSHGPFYIPDYQIYRLTGKRTAKWLDIWHGAGTAKPDGRAKMITDYDAAIVTSEFYRQALVEANPEIENKIHITGIPKFDLLDPDSKPKKMVVYAPSWENPAFKAPKKDANLPDRLKKTCDALGYKFVYRPHINESNESKDRPSVDLNKVAVLITDYSDIANDFALLKRPIIFIDRGFDPDDFVIPVQERGGMVTTEQKAHYALSAVLKTPWKHDQRYLDKFFAYQDRQNTARVVDLVKKML